MLRRSTRLSTQEQIKWYKRPLRCPEYGRNLLEDPLWNKATAFDQAERDRLGLRGLLPPAVRSIDEQIARTMAHVRSCATNVDRNLYLQDLHSRNETLFHRVLLDHIEEVSPLVYTPTVGETCQKFGDFFKRPRGMFFSTSDRGQFSTMVYNWPHDDVHVIVVTDGSRILGLGDLGAQGMGIPIGKLALYCAAGGIAPHRVLPVTLDVGTNNENLLKSPDYIGARHKRLVGEEYFDMVDEFMTAVFHRWPGVCVQFEDFETPKALPLLQKYRNKFRCFNDDIQGTGAVTVGALLSAARIADISLADLRVVTCGGGSAGQGVSASVCDAMVRAGLSHKEAQANIVMLTGDGAIGAPDGKYKNPHHDENGSVKDSQLREWRNENVSDGMNLMQVIKKHQPNVLLGLTGKPGVFKEEHIRELAKISPRPIIMPMSNPTSQAECSAAEAYHWTNGNAIVATGSPFEPVEYNGKKLIPSQCNNMYIFPGLGLAASVGGVQRFTDQMMYSAAQASSQGLTDQEIEEGRTFPRLNRIRTVSRDVAVACIKEAHSQLMTTKIKKHHVREGLENVVQRKMYFPHYVPLHSTVFDRK